MTPNKQQKRPLVWLHIRIANLQYYLIQPFLKIYGSKQNYMNKLQIHENLQKEFINIAAHELRTPIQPILGNNKYFEKQFKR